MPEVWFWIRERSSIYRLSDAGYTVAPRSRFAPGLDPAILEPLVHYAEIEVALPALLAAPGTPA